MFKEKIPYEYIDPVTVSTRFMYNVREFPTTSYVPKRKFAFADRQDDVADKEFTSKTVLPFGVSVDPVNEIIVYCKWLEVAENVVMDTRSYSDFDPMLTPRWSFRVHYEAVPNSFMRECLFEFLQQCDCTRSLADIIGAEYAYSAISEIASRDDSNPLERLTVSKISKLTSSVLSAALSVDAGSSKVTQTKNASKKPKLEGPLKDEQLMAMLYFLFPDAPQNTSNPYKISSIDNVRMKMIHNFSMDLDDDQQIFDCFFVCFIFNCD